MKGKFTSSAVEQAKNFAKRQEIYLAFFKSDDPTILENYVNMGKAYDKLGQYDKALFAFEKFAYST